jgi:hypothetical protein
MIPAALRIHPDDGILWTMLSRLLFGPERHQHLVRLRASCEGKRKGRDEQSRSGASEHRQILFPHSILWRAEELVHRGVPHARLLRDMVCVTAGCRGNSALGVRPANKGGVRKDTLPLMRLGA